MDRTSKLKVVLISPGCDADAVGEGGIAFQWASRIGRRHEVTLLSSRPSTRPPIASQLPHVRVVEWPDPAFFERWERFNAMLKPGYVPFYFRARRWLRQAVDSGQNFDLAHQIMPMALRYPSPAAGLGLKVILGPCGGSLENPRDFSMDFGSVPLFMKLRKLDDWRLRHDPWLRRSYSAASRIIAVAPYVKDLLGKVVPPETQFEFMTETGVAQLPEIQRIGWDGSRPLRLLFVGRVIRSKGLRDAIRALAHLKDLKNLTLDVVGDGEDMRACRREADALGVNQIVIFYGKRPRAEVDRFYSRADVFLFPSFREPSGTVVIEAMSHGLAMIVADRGGPSFVVDETCGFRVPVVNSTQFSSELATAIRKLVGAPHLVNTFGRAARDRIKREFLWDAKIDRLGKLYNCVLDAPKVGELTRTCERA